MLTPHLQASLLNLGLGTVLIPHFLYSDKTISRTLMYIYLLVINCDMWTRKLRHLRHLDVTITVDHTNAKVMKKWTTKLEEANISMQQYGLNPSTIFFGGNPKLCKKITNKNYFIARHSWMDHYYFYLNMCVSFEIHCKNNVKIN